MVGTLPGQLFLLDIMSDILWYAAAGCLVMALAYLILLIADDTTITSAALP
jgi:hypothetical protein